MTTIEDTDWELHELLIKWCKGKPYPNCFVYRCGVVYERRPDGIFVRTDLMEKFGINKPCPCGSGKKYKKCCA